jgi:hypothetical protein
MIFPPRRQLNECDIKYIGMDVHKEAIVIAVLNGSGKLVMESIVETKATSIRQFIHGLRGELHVTWAAGAQLTLFTHRYRLPMPRGPMQGIWRSSFAALCFRVSAKSSGRKVRRRLCRPSSCW